MSKDEKDNSKEFTFIREQILPRKKRKWKKACIALSATMVLAIVFGVIARIAFVMSESFVNRLLGIDSEKKTVVLTGSSGGSGDDSQLVVSEDDEDDKNEEDDSELVVDAEDTEANETEEETSQTVNNTYYVEKKITATAKDLVTMYSDLKKISNEAFDSIVTVVCAQESVDVLENPYEIKNEAPGLVVANNDVGFLILVSYEGICDASYVEVEFSGNVSVRAEVLDYNEETGLGMISVPLKKLSDYIIENTQVANLGESYLLTNGTPVLAVGSPNGVSGSFDFGIVTNSSGVVYITDMKLDLFYTSIVTSETGLGFIVNMDGAFVGVITNDFDETSSENVCTVIGISRVKNLIERMANGTERAYLGIVAQDMKSSELADAGISYGVYVSDVVAKSPAYETGIQVGDIIISINDSPVGGVNSLVSIIDMLECKEEIVVHVIRYSNGKYKELELDLTVGKAK